MHEYDHTLACRYFRNQWFLIDSWGRKREIGGVPELSDEYLIKLSPERVFPLAPSLSSPLILSSCVCGSSRQMREQKQRRKPIEHFYERKEGYRTQRNVHSSDSPNENEQFGSFLLTLSFSCLSSKLTTLQPTILTCKCNLSPSQNEEVKGQKSNSNQTERQERAGFRGTMSEEDVRDKNSKNHFHFIPLIHRKRLSAWRRTAGTEIGELKLQETRNETE